MQLQLLLDENVEEMFCNNHLGVGLSLHFATQCPENIDQFLVQIMQSIDHDSYFIATAQ